MNVLPWHPEPLDLLRHNRDRPYIQTCVSHLYTFKQYVRFTSALLLNLLCVDCCQAGILPLHMSFSCNCFVSTVGSSLHLSTYSRTHHALLDQQWHFATNLSQTFPPTCNASAHLWSYWSQIAVCHYLHACCLRNMWIRHRDSLTFSHPASGLHSHW